MVSCQSILQVSSFAALKKAQKKKIVSFDVTFFRFGVGLMADMAFDGVSCYG